MTPKTGGNPGGKAGVPKALPWKGADVSLQEPPDTPTPPLPPVVAPTGDARLLALEGLRLLVERDAARQVGEMVAEGWDPAQATHAYTTWITRLVEDAARTGTESVVAA